MSIKRYPRGGGPTGGSTIAGASDFDGTGGAVGQLVAVADVTSGSASEFGLTDPADLPVSTAAKATAVALALVLGG